MPQLTQVAMTPHERFMLLVEEQMATLEQQETALRIRDLKERAIQLNIPLNTGDIH